MGEGEEAGVIEKLMAFWSGRSPFLKDGLPSSRVFVAKLLQGLGFG